MRFIVGNEQEGIAPAASLPFTVSNAVQAAGSVAQYANLSGLTGAPLVFAEVSGTALTLQQTGAASFANITNTNFTNTSDVMFSCTYIV